VIDQSSRDARNWLNVQKVSREDLYEKVVEQLQELVVAQHLQIGDRLPGERELCETFGVSRNVIREATKVLAQRGVLAIEPGKGTFVTLPALESIADSIELFARARRVPFAYLVELRRALEPEIAALAARRAKPEHLQHMEQCITEMELNLSNPTAYVAADQEFHSTLAEATGNVLFVAMTGAIVNLAQSARKVMFEIPEAPRRGQHYHRQLLKFVAEGNSEAARQAMLEHLRQVEEDIAAAFQKQEGVPANN
jgi:GntR family transcriptional repressor for pyruvate dehydrogenase complex